MPTRNSPTFLQAVSAPAVFNIDNSIHAMEGEDKELGIQPAGAGALDISTGYNDECKRIVESFLNSLRQSKQFHYIRF